MKVLGVDVGTYSIKVAELDVTGRGYVVNNFEEFPLSVDPGQDKSLQIIETLRALSSRYDSTTRWVIGIPQQRVSTHLKEFPFRERPKILKALPFELEDDIPLDIDDTIFDAKIVEFAGSLAHVLTVASPKEAVEEALGVSKDGGFDPEIVSVEGLALANIFENFAAAPKEASAPSDETATAVTTNRARLILHMGYTRSLLLVYRDGALVSVRTILWGGMEIAEGLVKAFGLPMLEAVRTLNSKAFILMNSSGATRDQVLMSQTVSTAVDNLVRELRLTLLDVRAKFGLEYDQIELSGGVSQIQNLGPHITRGLELPANVTAQPLKAIPTRMGYTPQIEAVAPVAVGLALEALKRPRNPAINLRKDEFARENQTFKLFWENWRVTAQVAATIFPIFTVFAFARDYMASGMLETADETLTEVARNTAGLKGAAAMESGIRRYLREQQTIVKNREALSQVDDYVSAMDVVAKLSEALPVGSRSNPSQTLDVSFLSIDNDDVIIEGSVKGEPQLGLLQKALTEMARGRKLDKVQVLNSKPGPGTPFAFRMKIDRKP